jgi:hypothetical protein
MHSVRAPTGRTVRAATAHSGRMATVRSATRPVALHRYGITGTKTAKTTESATRIPRGPREPRRPGRLLSGPFITIVPPTIAAPVEETPTYLYGAPVADPGVTRPVPRAPSPTVSTTGAAAIGLAVIEAEAKVKQIEAAKKDFEEAYLALYREQALRNRVWATRGDMSALPSADADRVRAAGGWDAFMKNESTVQTLIGKYDETSAAFTKATR